MKNKKQQQQEENKLVSEGRISKNLVATKIDECLTLAFEHGIKIGRYKEKYKVV